MWDRTAGIFSVLTKKTSQSFKVQDFFARIHTEDIEGLKRCFEFINSAEPYDPVTHRFVFYYRFKNKTGEYLHIRDEKLAIESENGKYIYFTMFKNISNREKFFHVKLDILQYSKGDVVKVYTFDPRHTDHSITPKAKRNYKIDYKRFFYTGNRRPLHVSVNTVKNHKQALFRKVNVKSSVELINFASRR